MQSDRPAFRPARVDPTIPPFFLSVADRCPTFPRNETCPRPSEQRLVDLLLVENRNHPVCQRVVGNLRDLEKLVPVDATTAILVQLHETLFETYELRLRNCAIDKSERSERSAISWLRRLERSGERVTPRYTPG